MQPKVCTVQVRRLVPAYMCCECGCIIVWLPYLTTMAENVLKVPNIDGEYYSQICRDFLYVVLIQSKGILVTNMHIEDHLESLVVRKTGPYREVLCGHLTLALTRNLIHYLETRISFNRATHSFHRQLFVWTPLFTDDVLKNTPFS